MSTDKTKSSKVFWIFIATMLLGIIGYVVYALMGENTFINPVLQAGHESCRQAIVMRGAEYEKALMARKERIPELADTLVGYKAKWKLIWDGKEGFQKWTAEQIGNTLYNPEENQRLLAMSVKAVAYDWQEIENGMAKQLGRPVIGKTRSEEQVAAPKHTLPTGLDGTVMEQMMMDVAAIVGSEVAGYVCTQVAISSGVLATSAAAGWGTFGISLVAGVIVDWIISFFNDPTPQIEAELGKKLEENAATMRAEFERIMLEALNKRIKEWD